MCTLSEDKIYKLRIQYYEDYAAHKQEERLHPGASNNRDFQRTIKKIDVQAFVEVRLINTVLLDSDRNKE